MFERFTEDARSAVQGAVVVADQLRSDGVDVEAVRARAEATFGPGALDRGPHRRRRRRRHRWPFGADAKKALELSLREAIRLGDRHIEGAHVLLGVLRAECPGGRVLEPALHDAGTDVPALRTAVERHRRAA